jgi:hypothetical protein
VQVLDVVPLVLEKVQAVAGKIGYFTADIGNCA